MLVCIPTNGNTGLEDAVCNHFGSAGFFTLYDSDTGELNIIENRNAHHDHGTCHPMNQLAKHHIDCVVCSGMGRRAIEALNSEGIEIYKSNSVKVGEVIEQIKSGDLEKMDPAKACRGHGQKAGFAHGGDFGPVAGQGILRGSGYGRGGCRSRGGGQTGN